jgi:hypothetical protein
MVARLERQAARAQPEDNPLPDTEAHGENFLIDKVRSMDRKPEATRGGRSYIHGSSLIGICARRYALTILAGGAGSTSPREADRIMWAIGRAVEAHIRGQFVSAVKRKGVIGKWKCKCGNLKREGDFSNKSKCSACGQSPLHYHELELFDHDSRIVGNPDVMYLRPDNHKLRIVEIKSKKKELFEELTKPEPNHILQAAIYRRLAALNGMEVDDGVSIIYGCKDYPKWTVRPYKEYHIASTPEREAELDSMWERAQGVKSFLADHGDQGAAAELPDRIPACTSSTATPAKGCDQCQACFAR